jgi:hypothetical protein
MACQAAKPYGNLVEPVTKEGIPGRMNQQNLSQLGYTIYFHFDSDDQYTYIQYWMFYVFNPGSVNSHEGDWEMIQVVLDGDLQPIATTYSQHHSGVRAGWSDVLVQDESHPIVYVALGSHANYYRYYHYFHCYFHYQWI